MIPSDIDVKGFLNNNFYMFSPLDAHDVYFDVLQLDAFTWQYIPNDYTDMFGYRPAFPEMPPAPAEKLALREAQANNRNRSKYNREYVVLWRGNDGVTWKVVPPSVNAPDAQAFKPFSATMGNEFIRPGHEDWDDVNLDVQLPKGVTNSYEEFYQTEEGVLYYWPEISGWKLVIGRSTTVVTYRNYDYDLEVVFDGMAIASSQGKGIWTVQTPNGAESTGSFLYVYTDIEPALKEAAAWYTNEFRKFSESLPEVDGWDLDPPSIAILDWEAPFHYEFDGEPGISVTISGYSGLPTDSAYIEASFDRAGANFFTKSVTDLPNNIENVLAEILLVARGEQEEIDDKAAAAASVPTIPNYVLPTYEEVKDEVKRYWNADNHAFDPTLVGGKPLDNVRDLVRNTFIYSTKQLAPYIADSKAGFSSYTASIGDMISPANLSKVLRPILLAFSADGDAFDVRYRMSTLNDIAKGLREGSASGQGITVRQQNRLAEWLEIFSKGVVNYTHLVETMNSELPRQINQAMEELRSAKGAAKDLPKVGDIVFDAEGANIDVLFVTAIEDSYWGLAPKFRKVGASYVSNRVRSFSIVSDKVYSQTKSASDFTVEAVFKKRLGRSLLEKYAPGLLKTNPTLWLAHEGGTYELVNQAATTLPSEPPAAAPDPTELPTHYDLRIEGKAVTQWGVLARVDDYPYGRERTTAEFYVEHKTNTARGGRVTVNPKTGRKNKPKFTTYYDEVAIAITDDDYVYFVCYNKSYQWVYVYDGKLEQVEYTSKEKDPARVKALLAGIRSVEGKVPVENASQAATKARQAFVRDMKSTLTRALGIKLLVRTLSSKEDPTIGVRPIEPYAKLPEAFRRLVMSVIGSYPTGVYQNEIALSYAMWIEVMKRVKNGELAKLEQAK